MTALLEARAETASSDRRRRRAVEQAHCMDGSRDRCGRSGIGRSNRLARALGHAARQGAGKPGSTRVRPPPDRVGCALPLFRHGLRREPALAVEADEESLLGPSRRCGDGGERGVHRSHLVDRAPYGADRPGGSGGPGTPGSPRRRCCS